MKTSVGELRKLAGLPAPDVHALQLKLDYAMLRDSARIPSIRALLLTPVLCNGKPFCTVGFWLGVKLVNDPVEPYLKYVSGSEYT